jgi:lipoyl(octanoyl) transferase
MEGEPLVRTVALLCLGRVEFEDGLVLQRSFRQARTAGATGDVLLLVEHPPVVTFGRAAKRGNVVWAAERLVQEGLTVHETERGGDVTYHGPGQIVGYPIVDLAPDRKDVRRYVRDLEEVLLRVLAAWGITAHRDARWPGVWVRGPRGLAKVAALGVHLSRWVTMHGFALNVDPNLSHFSSIIPCGIEEAGVTSMAELLGEAPPREAVEASVARAFGEVFGASVFAAPAPTKTVAVHLVRRSTNGPELLLFQRAPERGGFWQPVTGHIDPGESAQSAAAREVSEETGAAWEVQPLGYRHAFALGQASPPALREETAFLAAWRGQVARLSGEHVSSAWFPLRRALELLPFEGLREGARRAVRALG